MPLADKCLCPSRWKSLTATRCGDMDLLEDEQQQKRRKIKEHNCLRGATRMADGDFMVFAEAGEAQLRQGEREAAIASFQAALSCGSKNAPLLSVVNSQCGSCYYAMGMLDEAAKHHEADVAITRRIRDAPGAASAYGNLGAFFFS